MYNTIFTNCDGCGNVLEGTQGTHTFREKHLQLRANQITTIEFDPQTNEKSVIFIDSKDNHYLHFCNGNCFQSWCDARTIIRKQSRADRDNWDWNVE